MIEPVRVRWAATKEGVEDFVSLVMALHHGVLATCPACEELAHVVVLDDRAKSLAGYECKCGATFTKRSKFVYQFVDDES